MNVEILYSNLGNPTLLFFILGIVATLIRSDLEIPAQSVKFISLYLLLSIGFKGGQELSKSSLGMDVYIALLVGIILSAIIPFYIFFLLRKKLGPENAGGIAATYGSVSAVTFVAAVAFLEYLGITMRGHMVAVMAAMEIPAIIVSVYLIFRYSQNSDGNKSMAKLLHHSISNGSVIILLGSLAIGFFSDAKQAEGIKPFTNDIFKGFLAIFLLDLGMQTAKRISSLKTYGYSVALWALVFPLVNGVATAFLSRLFIDDIGDRFILSTLAASASYIAVPASLKLASPKSDPALFVPMAIAVTFPFNITFGMPLYFYLCK